MFAAARVMAAGKAGLESLPYFVEELLAQGITQLAPWAADHTDEQIEKLNRDTEGQRSAAWRDIYEIGDAPLGVKMQPNAPAPKALLSLVNPLVVEDGLANSPAQLAAWCRWNIQQTCWDTVQMWDKFKRNSGITHDLKLAVVIPYCPEGPTSGTVGMYLGAALRKHFADIRRGHELEVWGIELCPPVNTDATGALDKDAMEHAFRGYVARQELLKGVPVTENENDEVFVKPYDINIVFDGGSVEAAGDFYDDMWQALDRAAAQTTACLLNGAAGLDQAESFARLNVGSKRWNAHLTHVVSEAAHNRECLYLNYQVQLPWEGDPTGWAKKKSKSGGKPKKTLEKYQEFLRCVESYVRPQWNGEKDLVVRESVGKLVKVADDLEALRKGIKSLLPKNKEVNSHLDLAKRESDGWPSHGNSSAPDKILVRPDPFCLTIRLPRYLRLENAKRLQGDSGPIADLLGAAGVTMIRDWIENQLNPVLGRRDCQPANIPSAAKFEEIIAISIADQTKRGDNRQFQPSQQFLKYFIAAATRPIPGTFNIREHNLADYVRTGGPEAIQPKALHWRVNNVDFDVPVEYSSLVLARCRPEDGFRDISVYDRLEAEYRKLTSDVSLWRDYAKYYGVKPPAELLATAAPEHTASQPSRNGSAEAAPAEGSETNGHREFVEQEV